MEKDINQTALALSDGESTGHLVCPECLGGRTKERSFVAWRVGASVFYKCHRVSCGYGGAHDSVSTDLVAQTVAAKKPLRPYTGATRKLSDGELEYAWKNWWLSEDDLVRQGVCADVLTGRLVFPCYTKEGWCWGHQLRALDGKRPKVLLYWHSLYPERLHFPKGPCGDTVIIVEDIPSAIKIASYEEPQFSGAALLGTSLPPNVGAILSRAYRKAVLCLDADATAKAVAHKKKYSMMFDSLEVFPLRKDVKNMTHEELAEFLGALAPRNLRGST